MHFQRIICWLLMILWWHWVRQDWSKKTAEVWTAAEPFVMPANQVTKTGPELRHRGVTLSFVHSEVPMLTSTSAGSATAWRGDPAIFLSINGGDISLAHNRREGRREGVRWGEVWCGAVRLYCGWKYQWGSMAFKFTGLSSLRSGQRGGVRKTL